MDALKVAFGVGQVVPTPDRVDDANTHSWNNTLPFFVESLAELRYREVRLCSFVAVHKISQKKGDST